MAIHVIQQGECLSSLAARRGQTTMAIWDHPANAQLRENRANPNVLAPGDEITLPDLRSKSETAKVERVNKFIAKVPRVKLHLAVLNPRGEPYEGKRYVLEVGARIIEGRTGRNGIIDASVPATAHAAELRVWFADDDDEPDLQRDLAIGHLDPIDSMTGVQGRLANLGFPCAVNGETDELTLLATRMFRARNGLPEITNEQDDEAAAGENAAESAGQSDEEKTEDVAPSYADRLIDDAFRAKLLSAYEGP